MKFPKSLLSLFALVIFVGCGSVQRAQRDMSYEVAKPAPQALADPERRVTLSDQDPNLTQVSLKQAGQSQSTAEAMDRKILRNAELTLEVGTPAEVQRKITSIAESLGGFVVTSESKLRQVGDSKQELEVNLVIRVPATQFGAAMDQIRSTGTRVLQEKVTGEDVTEEFIDLEARIKTQQALELQFLEIMKQASKVPDALEVQRQIAEVRTTIERLEGRKRFLENRASLSTINVTLQSPNAIVVNTSGFGRNIRQAVADAVEIAIAIVLFLIRFVIVMIPVFLLIILPGWFLARFVFRRVRKRPSNVGSPKPADPASDSPPA
ncbi:MAG TPA: DUF4349 domain-containing protein [Pyrinomonadaceae bacterium]|nr:DUF4349 domain-containing protein [Pyrinomonadaceae bacterium]